MNKIFSLLIFTLASLLLLPQAYGAAYDCIPSEDPIENAIRAITDDRDFEQFFSIVNARYSGDDCSKKPLDASDKKHLTALFSTMLDREKLYHDDFRVFYHGSQFEYYKYLLLNKLLMAKKIGYEPADFEFLRASGTRRDITDVRLSDYMARSYEHPYFDHHDYVREQLLAVSYSPFLHKVGESASSFFLENCSMSDPDDHVTELLRPVGCSLAKFLILDPKVSLSLFGVMLQIFIKKDRVDELAYDSHSFGVARGLIPRSAVGALDDEHTQARILLRPQYFDLPNDAVKIFVYTCLSAEEQANLHAAVQDYIIVLKKSC